MYKNVHVCIVRKQGKNIFHTNLGPLFLEVLSYQDFSKKPVE